MGEILFPKISLREFDLEGKECENVNVEDSSCGSSSKTYLCSTCGKAFRSKNALLRHKMSHTGAKPFSCDVCKVGLSSAVSLKEHMAKHSEQKLYECSICGRDFRQNSSYRRHLTTHSKASPHECDVCKKRFALSAYLLSHKRTHTKEKPYLCDPPCNKSFAHLSDLKRHRVIHTGERPYKCDVCGSSFADRSSRRRHQKDHENKPWNNACKVCKASFKKATQLEKHMSKVHRLTLLPSLKGGENVRNSSTVPAQISGNNLSVGTVQLLPSRNTSLMETPASDVQKSQEAVLLDIPDGYLSSKENHPQCRTNCPDTSSMQVINSCDPTKASNPCSLPHLLSKDQEDSLRHPRHDAVEIASALSSQKTHLPSADYVMYPDFNNQEYYEWLANFVSLCKLLPYPVESEVFSKINQVHKSIIDCLSSRSTLVCNRTSFKTLMDLSQDLLRIINGQLNFILNQFPD